jgi:hypothetical protein
VSQKAAFPHAPPPVANIQEIQIVLCTSLYYDQNMDELLILLSVEVVTEDHVPGTEEHLESCLLLLLGGHIKQISSHISLESTNGNKCSEWGAAGDPLKPGGQESDRIEKVDFVQVLILYMGRQRPKGLSLSVEDQISGRIQVFFFSNSCSLQVTILPCVFSNF